MVLGDMGAVETMLIRSFVCADESNMLVVTYADVARCLASAYRDMQPQTTVTRDS